MAEQEENQALPSEEESAPTLADEPNFSWFGNLLAGYGDVAHEQREKVLSSFDMDGVVEFIKSDKCKHIITMAGAGISTSAGIPDFRSPGSGLYDNLQKYNLPSPQAMFEIGFFKENPEPFFQLAKQLWPGTFRPTPCHLFLRLLRDKGLLLRHYTQNIDTLERVAGLNEEDIVEAHGTFHQAHCLGCSQQYSQDWVKERVFKDEIPRCELESCAGLVKPDIVFFGESLPKKFFECISEDLSRCDLLIILGTSLVVQPFASLTSRVPDTTPRLYINLDPPPVCADPVMRMLGMGCDFQLDPERNYRDVFWQGTCDAGCQLLAEKLGFQADFEQLLLAHKSRDDMEQLTEALSGNKL